MKNAPLFLAVFALNSLASAILERYKKTDPMYKKRLVMIF